MLRTPRNPFRTRRIRPEAMNYLFDDAYSCSTVVKALQQNHWRGQIIGPHGSGKTTLLQALLPACQQRDRQVAQFSLHDRERRLPFQWKDATAWSAKTLIVIDGYEQLNWVARSRLRILTQQKKCGLLVTTHREVSLPVIFRTSTSIELTQKIVRQLVSHDSQISPADVTCAYQQCQGNVRETLFALYDLYQDRHRQTRRLG
ncbi:MAG: hypothetical protein P8N76_20450 [Pirellulaceae bacterium]|nr:hypothetical protein [Pirellulaceae bacterium]